MAIFTSEKAQKKKKQTQQRWYSGHVCEYSQLEKRFSEIHMMEKQQQAVKKGSSTRGWTECSAFQTFISSIYTQYRRVILLSDT